MGKASYVKLVFFFFSGFPRKLGMLSGLDLTWNKKTESNFGGSEGGREQETRETTSILVGFTFI